MEDLDQFSSETLNEMEMEAVVGGNHPIVQNCAGGYCGSSCSN